MRLAAACVATGFLMNNSIRVLGVVAGLSASWAANAGPRDGLLLQYTFDDATGTVIEDSSDNGWDAMATEVPLLLPAPGVDNQGMFFDGATDAVDLPVEALDAVGALTEGTIFVRFRYLNELDVRPIEPLVYMGIDNEGDADNLFVIEIGHDSASNHRLYFTWVRNGSLRLCFDTNFNLQQGKMYSFAGIVGPDGNTGYLNGMELVDRRYNSGNQNTVYFFSDLPDDTKEIFTLGFGKTDDFQSRHFESFIGQIDEFRVYDRPLAGWEAERLTYLP